MYLKLVKNYWICYSESLEYLQAIFQTNNFPIVNIVYIVQIVHINKFTNCSCSLLLDFHECTMVVKAKLENCGHIPIDLMLNFSTGED